jgi:hypothetical protein
MPTKKVKKTFGIVHILIMLSNNVSANINPRLPTSTHLLYYIMLHSKNKCVPTYFNNTV